MIGTSATMCAPHDLVCSYVHTRGSRGTIGATGESIDEMRE